MIICENNTVFAKSDFWSKTRQPAPVSPTGVFQCADFVIIFNSWRCTRVTLAVMLSSAGCARYCTVCAYMTAD